MAPPISRRAFLGTGGALVVGLGLGGRVARRAAAQAGSVPPPVAWTTDRYLGKTVAPDQVDAFLAIHADNTVTVFTGKVDLGTGGRAAMRQMVAEELDVAIERITELIEGDTAVARIRAAPAAARGSPAAARSYGAPARPRARRSSLSRPSGSAGPSGTSRSPTGSCARRAAVRASRTAT